MSGIIKKTDKKPERKSSFINELGPRGTDALIQTHGIILGSRRGEGFFSIDITFHVIVLYNENCTKSFKFVLKLFQSNAILYKI